jgi:hypothetical protein
MRRPVVAGLLVALLTACSGPAETPTAPAPAAAATAAPTGHAGATGLELEARRHATAQRILHRRAAAVRTGDERAFLADLVRGDPALRARQRRLFANLVSLPLQTFTLDAAQATWPAGFAAPRYRRSAYIPYVEQRLRLRGLDDAPATTVYGLTLAPVRGRWRIVSDDDTAGRESDGARDAPWDLTRIVVRRTPHALGIFDTLSAPAADRLMAWTEDSIRTVRQRVPLRWPGTVTVYALSSPRLLARMGTRYLDRAAIAFPVLDDNTRPTRRVSTRVLINPRHLPQTEHEAGYLLSHEITHVALARTDAGTPAWVQEGLADYVATRGASPSWWQPSPASVARALDGAAAMPGSTFFGDADPGFEYDLSLAACAYLADRFGERRLWVFLRRLAAAGRAAGDSEEPVDPMLRTMFGIDTSRLAGEAARLVVRRGGAT